MSFVKLPHFKDKSFLNFYIYLWVILVTHRQTFGESSEADEDTACYVVARCRDCASDASAQPKLESPFAGLLMNGFISGTFFRSIWIGHERNQSI
jgi:hypothetical protein